VLAWLAGQEDVTTAFRDARDVYCEFATKVYKRDITKADPVERFVGKTCILGLGYGTGWRKLQHTLKTSPPGANLSDEECERIVTLYRGSNDKITELWGECERALKSLIAWPEGRKNYYLGQNKALVITPDGIRLPNRLYIRYPDLQVKDGKYVYNSRKGEIGLWGGAIVENVVQALARIVVGEQMLKISQKYPVALTVHDAAVCVVPEGEIKEAVKFVTDIMSTAPDWAKTLPVACEAKYAYSYGSC
jgi:DNA polymerase